MNILVIGSKGFIGTHCMAYFTAKRENVFGCDVVVDYTNDNYYLIDATNSNFAEIFQSNNFDVCINCSGAASVPDSMSHPLRDFRLNSANVFNILDAIRQFNPTCKLVNISSAAVYGNPQSLPVKESQKINPLSPYGFHKKYSEEICREFYIFFGVKSCSLRVFSAYGEGLKKQLLWDLSKKMRASGTAISMFGTGKETRDFIHVSDIVKTIDLIIENADFAGEAINIGNGEELSIQFIANLFAQKMNWKGEILFSGENRKGDPLNWSADIDIIKKYGYSQQTRIEEGIEKYIIWANANA